MGVRYLESYLERNSRACHKVRIPFLVDVYRERTNNAVPVVVLDGMSCLRPLYGKLSWLNGGQYKEFYEIVEKFINNFTSLGCELVVYFDGSVQNIKLPVWKKRKIHSMNEAAAIFDMLNDRKTLYIESNPSTSFLPNGIGTMFLFLLSQHPNCKVCKSLIECDEEIARYAFNNKCFAILAQDTDYVIYKGAMFYLSVKNLNIDEMTTLCYDRLELADELGFHPNRLPLFASLMGNDIIEHESVKNFQYRLKKKSRSHDFVLLVANFIKSLKYIDFLKIALTVFGAVEKANLLRQSFQSYDLSKPPEALTIVPSSNDKWDEILQFSLKKYVDSYHTSPLYDILFLNRFFNSTCLEDYRDENIIVPVGTLLKELRRSMYGILLHEMPRKGDEPVIVKELVMTGYESMKDFVDVQPKFLKVCHPGLMSLWTSKEESVEQIRWEILGEIFSSDPREMKNLPLRLLVPSLAARYIIGQFPGVADWELNAYIACCVCVKSYKAKDLAKLPSDPLVYRQIWLYTALSRTCATINHILFFIGDPISFEEILPFQYTDGKLFHEFYRQSGNKRATVETLCGHRVENMECFNLLRSFITN